jgi:site-specific recombinase XerD
MSATVSTQITTYLSTLDFNKSPKTKATYTTALNDFMRIVGKDAPLTIETYITYLQKTHGYNASTQALYRSAIKNLYIFYGSTHPDEVNILAILQANKQYALPVIADKVKFNLDSIEALIKYALAHTDTLIDLRDRAFVLIMADSGLRISEARSLTRKDIEWLEGRASFPAKGGKRATVNLSNRTLTALREYLDARSDLDQKSGKAKESLPVFARHDDGAGSKIKWIRSTGMWIAIKELAMRAGVDPDSFRVHDFRHYFVTRVYKETRDIEATRKLARHKHVSTTTRYVEIADEMAETYHNIFNRKDTP